MNGPHSGSEAANLIARLDWSATPLGESGHWPQSLRTAVDIVIHSPMPMPVSYTHLTLPTKA